MHRPRHPAAIWLTVLTLSCPAAAWWDTQITVHKDPPTVRTIQAEDCPGMADHVVADADAWGQRCVRLAPSQGALAFEHDARVSHYCLHVICRSAAPAGQFRKPSPPVILHLRVTHLATGESSETRARVCFTAKWHAAGHLYFPIRRAGRYRIEVFSGGRSVEPVLVDFMELKDLFKNLPAAGSKRARNLHTDEQVARLRRLPKNRERAAELSAEQKALGFEADDDDAVRRWRAETFEDYWGMIPPRNMHFGRGRNGGEHADALGEYARKAIQAAGGVEQWTLGDGPGPWTFTHPKTGATYTLADWKAGRLAGDCAFPDDGTGFWAPRETTGAGWPYQRNWLAAELMSRYRQLGLRAMRRGRDYLRTGDEKAGWEGVCALIAFCDMYPDIDMLSQSFRFKGMQFGLTMHDKGKYYASHNTNWVVEVMKAYDNLFPLIDGNAQLAELLAARAPWVNKPADVVTFIDRKLLYHYRDCVSRMECRAPEGEGEAAVAIAAVVAGPGEAADWMWKLVFSQNYWRMQHRGGMQDHLASTLNRDGVSGDVGSAEYAKAAAGSVAILHAMAKRYKELGGKLAFDLTDLDRWPKCRRSPYYPLMRKVAGVWTPRIGDWGTAADPPQLKEEAYYQYASDAYRFGWEITGDKRFAWLIRYLGRRAETDAQWSAIERAANAQGVNPFLVNRTRHLPGFGMAILEAHANRSEWREKAGAVLRTGVGMNHGHCDQLNLIYYGAGCRLLPDMGRRYRGRVWNNGMHAGLPGETARADWWDDTPGGRTTRVHNVVEVDDKDFLNVCYNRSGVGWASSCAEMQGVSYVRGSAYAQSHDHLKTYSRDVALIPVGRDRSYLVDVFRVAGGTVHTQCCGGPVNSSPEQVTFNVPLTEAEAASSQNREQYPGPGYFHLLRGTCPDTLEITWQVDPNTTRRYWDRKTGEIPAAFVRMHRLGVEGAAVIRGWTRVHDWTGRGTEHNFVFVRHTDANSPSLQGAYATVTEGYLDDSPVIARIESIPLAPDTGAMAARAARVVTTDGQDDLVYADGDGRTRRSLPGEVAVEGQFAYVSRQEGRVRRVALLGGRLLAAGKIRIEPATARYGGTVRKVDLAANTITLDAPLPDAVLAGETIHVHRPAVHDAAYVIEKTDGKVVHLRGSMIAFRSAIANFDPNTGGVQTELPPPYINAMDTYYDNLALANETGTILGRAKIVYGDRWMYLPFPPESSWRQHITMDEIVDADGDGRRTLRLIAEKPIKRWIAPGNTPVVPAGGRMADLEVTAVRDDGRMIWFKNPPEQYCYTYDIPHASWCYQGMHMVTEDGKRKLTANYPGREYAITLVGRALVEADLPDADGDGRRELILCDIAPGDVVDTPSRVSAFETATGDWSVESTCDVKLRLPDGVRDLAAERFADGPIRLPTDER